MPDALRRLPGIFVGRRNSNSWALSSRGFSSVNSEKLLVLSDTRSIYTPLFSGVFWDVQDYLLEDIDRIEVIRGPGAALWGSNAVNGVINITTKSARDTQGTYLEAGTGTEERVNAAARFGGETGHGIYYRVFGHYVDRDASFNSSASTSDDWRLAHVGFGRTGIAATVMRSLCKATCIKAMSASSRPPSRSLADLDRRVTSKPVSVAAIFSHGGATRSMQVRISNCVRTTIEPIATTRAF